MLFDERADLRIFVPPLLREIVIEDDLPFVGSLFGDFLVRAKEHPDELFRQLSCLNLGPLVTFEVESQLSAHPHLLALVQSFIPYE